MVQGNKGRKELVEKAVELRKALNQKVGLAHSIRAVEATDGDLARALRWLIREKLISRSDHTVDGLLDRWKLPEPKWEEYVLEQARRVVHGGVAAIDPDLDSEEAPEVEAGFVQLAGGAGTSPERPLSGVGLWHIIEMLMAMRMYIKGVEREAGSLVDRIQCDHLSYCWRRQNPVLYAAVDREIGAVDAPDGYGLEPRVPIRTGGDHGAMAVLELLRCHCGQPFLFHQTGVVPGGAAGDTPVERYRVRCRRRHAHRFTLYFDTSRPRALPIPPAGMSLASPEGLGFPHTVEGFEEMSYEELNRSIVFVVQERPTGIFLGDSYEPFAIFKVPEPWG